MERPLKAQTPSTTMLTGPILLLWPRRDFLSDLAQRKREKIITTASRHLDPAMAALVAAQLCYRVSQTDTIYKLRARRLLSSEAVHRIYQAVVQSKRYEQETKFMAEFLRVFDNPSSQRVVVLMSKSRLKTKINLPKTSQRHQDKARQHMKALIVRNRKHKMPVSYVRVRQSSGKEHRSPKITK